MNYKNIFINKSFVLLLVAFVSYGFINLCYQNVVHACHEVPTATKMSKPYNMNLDKPSTVKHVHYPKHGVDVNIPHIHFTDGTSLKDTGAVSHKGKGIHILTKKEKKWLVKHNWMYYCLCIKSYIWTIGVF